MSPLVSLLLSFFMSVLVPFCYSSCRYFFLLHPNKKSFVYQGNEIILKQHKNPSSNVFFSNAFLRLPKLWSLVSQKASKPSSRPQRQVAGPFVRGEVEHAVQGWAVAWPRLWSSRPGAAQGCARNGELNRDRTGSPPASRPAGGRSAAHGARRSLTRSRTKHLRCRVPAASYRRAQDHELLSPATREFRVRAIRPPQWCMDAGDPFW